MKRLVVTSPVLVLFAVGIAVGAAGSVWGQTGDPGVGGERVRDEREFRRVPGALVYGDEGGDSWRRTGVEVRRGQRVEISAGGVVRWAPGGREKIEVGPDGTRPPYRDGWNYNHFPFPEAGIGSLVMRIGKGVYAAGSSVVIEAEDSGLVEFMVNDDRLDDNSGQFDVRVSLKPV